MSCSGGKFPPDGLYDSGGDSTTLVTGKYTAKYFIYKSGVGCVCILNDRFSSVQCLAHEEVSRLTVRTI